MVTQMFNQDMCQELENLGLGRAGNNFVTSQSHTRNGEKIPVFRWMKRKKFNIMTTSHFPKKREKFLIFFCRRAVISSNHVIIPLPTTVIPYMTYLCRYNNNHLYVLLPVHTYRYYHRTVKCRPNSV